MHVCQSHHPRRHESRISTATVRSTHAPLLLTFQDRDVPYGEYLLNYHAKHKTEAVADSEHESDNSASPMAYDVRNVGGVSYASINRNQNSPRACESSWAQAATSALNDRFAMLKQTAYPEVVLSVQVRPY